MLGLPPKPIYSLIAIVATSSSLPKGVEKVLKKSLVYGQI